MRELQKANFALQKMAAEQLASIKALEDQLYTQKASVSNMQSLLETVQQENTALRSRNMILKAKESHLQEFIETSNPQRLEKANQEVAAFHRKDLDRHREAAESLKTRIGALAAENDALRLALQVAKAADHRELKAECEQLRLALQAKEQEVSRAVRGEGQLRAEVSALQQQIARKDRKQQELESVLASIKKNEEELKRRNQELANEKEYQRDKNREITQDFEILKRSYDMTRTQAESWLKGQETLREELRKVKQDLRDLEQARKQSASEDAHQSRLTLELTSLRQSLASCELSLERQAKEMFLLKSQYDGLKGELKAAIEAKSMAASLAKDLKAENTQQKLQLIESKAKLDVLEKELKAAETSVLGFSTAFRPNSAQTDMVIKETGSQWAQDARKQTLGGPAQGSHMSSLPASRHELFNLDLEMNQSAHSQSLLESKDKSGDSHRLNIDPAAYIGGLLESIDEVIEMTNRLSDHSQDLKCTRRSLDSFLEGSYRDSSMLQVNKSTQKEPTFRNYASFLKAMAPAKGLDVIFKETCANRSGVFFKNQFLEVSLASVKTAMKEPQNEGEVSFSLLLKSRSPLQSLETTIINYSKLNSNLALIGDAQSTQVELDSFQVDFRIVVQSPEFMVPPIVHCSGSIAGQSFSIEATVPLTSILFLKEVVEPTGKVVSDRIHSSMEELSVSLPMSKAKTIESNSALTQP